MDSFIKDYPYDPLIATVGDGGFQIVVYIHKKKHNLKFPKVYKDIPVIVRYIGRVMPC